MKIDFEKIHDCKNCGTSVDWLDKDSMCKKCGWNTVVRKFLESREAEEAAFKLNTTRMNMMSMMKLAFKDEQEQGKDGLCG